MDARRVEKERQRDYDGGARAIHEDMRCLLDVSV